MNPIERMFPDVEELGRDIKGLVDPEHVKHWIPLIELYNAKTFYPPETVAKIICKVAAMTVLLGEAEGRAEMQDLLKTTATALPEVVGVG